MPTHAADTGLGGSDALRDLPAAPAQPGDPPPVRVAPPVVVPAKVALGYQARNRLDAWRYALATTNPPAGEIDQVTRWLVLTRAAVLPMTVTAGAVAGLLAVPRAAHVSVGLYLLALVGITLAHVANNLMNDLFDSSVGQDSAGYPRALYAPHPVLSGLASRRSLLAAALLANLADAAILVVLAVARGPVVVGFAVGGFVLSVAYTAPPLRLKKRGLGEPDVLVVWGPLMVGGVYFAGTGTMPWQVLAASVPYALLCTSVLMGKHVDKIAFDAPLAIRTLPVLLGERRARASTRGLLAAFYLSVAVCVGVGALPWPTLLVAFGLPRLRQAWRLLARPAPEQAPAGFPIWPLWFAAVAFVHLRRAGLLLIAGLAIGAGLGIR